MLDGPKADNVDRLLDELEVLATSNSSSGDFFRQLLLRLNFLLDANGSAIIVPARDESWLMLASGGEVDARETQRICAHISELNSAVEQRDNSNSGSSEIRVHRNEGNHYWIGAPLRSSSWKHGGLIACLAVEPPQAALLGLSELVAAVAEIAAIRQIRELEKFFDDRWYRLQQASLLVSTANSRQDAACLLVNELLAIIGADRVSLFDSSVVGKSRCLAVSGIEAIDRRAVTVKEIELFADSALVDGTVVARKPADSLRDDSSSVELHSTLANALAIPFSSERSSANRKRTDGPTHNNSRQFDSVVVIEWASREKYYEAAPLLHHLLPSIEHAWREHWRWSRVPKVFRRLSDHRGGLLSWFSWRALRWAALLLLVGAILVAVQIPQDLKIEASGTLEPVEQRTIFATADGFIEQLLVEDGNKVQLGELIAVLRSPTIALQIQEYEGQLLTLAEKRSGLQIAVNQLSPADPFLTVTQSRLSAEIREIDVGVENVRQLLAAFDSESKKLELRSPIHGVVVASELRRNLQSRPVRRGDALLRVVALDGPWRLELEVPDRDSAYVIKSYGSSDSGDEFIRSDRQVEFVLTAHPKQRFTGEVQWISNATRNPHGTGSYVDVHVRVAREASEQGHLSSTVLAYFSCGEQPWWFVWSRPLVEAIQRRMWF